MSRVALRLCDGLALAQFPLMLAIATAIMFIASPEWLQGHAAAELESLMKAGVTRDNIHEYVALIEHRVVTVCQRSRFELWIRLTFLLFLRCPCFVNASLFFLCILVRFVLQPFVARSHSCIVSTLAGTWHDGICWAPAVFRVSGTLRFTDCFIIFTVLVYCIMQLLPEFVHVMDSRGGVHQVVLDEHVKLSVQPPTTMDVSVHQSEDAMPHNSLLLTLDAELTALQR
jgi:hypothetical protein